jgi:hypothetical protein
MTIAQRLHSNATHKHGADSNCPVCLPGLQFGGIRHIIEYPSKRFGFVGSVPRDLGYAEGRVRSFESVEAALTASRGVSAGTLCSIPTCACRKLFPVQEASNA